MQNSELTRYYTPLVPSLSRPLETRLINRNTSSHQKEKQVTYTFYKHYEGILNFINNRSTNAATESSNAKVKGFRRAFRGVADL